MDKKKLNRSLVSYIALVGTVIIFAYFLYQLLLSLDTVQYLSDKNSDPFIEQKLDTTYTDAIRKADISAVDNVPPVASIDMSTTEGVQNVFGIAHLHYAFGLHNKTVEYLVAILDSSEPAAEPFKSIAAYSLLHTFYDSNRDIEFMANAVNASVFMREQITPKAKLIFPGLFDQPLAGMSYSQKALYFISYLIALSDREDSIAIPANASIELSREYIPLKKQGIRKEQMTTYEDMLRTQLEITRTRLDKRLYSDLKKDVSAHDTVVGINLFSTTVNDLRLFSFEKNFAEIDGVDPSVLFPLSYEIAKRAVPSLKNFTAYLNILQLARYSQNTEENNNRINSIAKEIIGESPFDGVVEHTWAAQNLLNTKSQDYYANFFRKENIAAIARRSSLLKEFLILKESWTDADFELRVRY